MAEALCGLKTRATETNATASAACALAVPRLATAACCNATVIASFNHFIGPQQERLGYRQAKRLGGRQVDHELEPGRLLDRKIGGLCAFENFVDKIARATEQIR